MTAELTLRFHDVRAAEAPTEWSDFLRAGHGHSLWHWSVVRSAAAASRGTMLAGTFHDGESVVGIVVTRLRGLSARRPWITVADVDCPGSAAMPGLVMTGGVPGALAPGAVDVDLYRAAMRTFEATLRHDYGRRVRLVWYRQMFAEVLPVALDRDLALTYAGAPVAQFRNRFDDFDAYLRTLSKSRRVDVRRIGRALDADPQLTIVLDDKPDDLDLRAAERLMMSTARRNHTHRWPPLQVPPPQVRDALATAPGTQVLRYTYADGRLLGVGLLFDHAVVPLHGQWGGLDAKDEGGRSGLWFDQMARTMRWTIESGRAGLIGGKGRGSLKAEFGFEAVPQWTVVRRLR